MIKVKNVIWTLNLEKQCIQLFTNCRRINDTVDSALYNMLGKNMLIALTLNLFL